MKGRILACFLLLSGCEDRPTEIANFAAADNGDAIDDGGSVMDGWNDANAMVGEPHLTPEEHRDELARLQREEEERAKEERWRQSVLPTPRDAFPKVGTCYASRIKQIEISHANGGTWPSYYDTLETWKWERHPIRRHGRISIPYSGYIEYTNGLEQYLDGYWTRREPPPVARSRVGDRVMMCVAALPAHCPPGDFRGVTYRTRNLRTGGAWEFSDSSRGCGNW